MATAVLLDWKGVTWNEYVDVVERLDLDGSPPAGGRLHLAGSTDDGMRIVDVWDSPQDFDRFSNERLAPVLQEVGVSTAPDVTMFEIGNVFAPAADDLMKAGASSRP